MQSLQPAQVMMSRKNVKLVRLTIVSLIILVRQLNNIPVPQLFTVLAILLVRPLQQIPVAIIQLTNATLPTHLYQSNFHI